jgi:hypothetical protein
MVIPEARAELCEALSALIAGRLSNDRFDDVYYRLCVRSPDRAVEEIGLFGWGLYSSDLLWPYYLTGIHAVSAETRALAERCTLFLVSGLEYEWPPFPDLGWVDFAKVFAVLGCLLSLLAAALLLLAPSNIACVNVVISLIAVLAGVSGLWAYHWLSWYEKRRRSEFWSCGRGRSSPRQRCSKRVARAPNHQVAAVARRSSLRPQER